MDASIEISKQTFEIESPTSKPNDFPFGPISVLVRHCSYSEKQKAYFVLMESQLTNNEYPLIVFKASIRPCDNQFIIPSEFDLDEKGRYLVDQAAHRNKIPTQYVGIFQEDTFKWDQCKETAIQMFLFLTIGPFSFLIKRIRANKRILGCMYITMYCLFVWLMMIGFVAITLKYWNHEKSVAWNLLIDTSYSEVFIVERSRIFAFMYVLFISFFVSWSSFCSKSHYELCRNLNSWDLKFVLASAQTVLPTTVCEETLYIASKNDIDLSSLRLTYLDQSIDQTIQNTLEERSKVSSSIFIEYIRGKHIDRCSFNKWYDEFLTAFYGYHYSDICPDNLEKPGNNILTTIIEEYSPSEGAFAIIRWIFYIVRIIVTIYFNMDAFKVFSIGKKVGYISSAIVTPYILYLIWFSIKKIPDTISRKRYFMDALIDMIDPKSRFNKAINVFDPKNLRVWADLRKILNQYDDRFLRKISIFLAIALIYHLSFLGMIVLELLGIFNFLDEHHIKAAAIIGVDAVFVYAIAILLLFRGAMLNTTYQQHISVLTRLKTEFHKFMIYNSGPKEGPETVGRLQNTFYFEKGMQYFVDLYGHDPKELRRQANLLEKTYDSIIAELHDEEKMRSFSIVGIPLSLTILKTILWLTGSACIFLAPRIFKPK